MTCERSVPAVSRVIADFLRRKDLDDENAPWALGESPLGGIGIFATRDIACGEEIFRDYPVIDGPRIKHSNSLFCVACYKQTNLAPCPKRCGLPICSKICTQHHQSECHQIKTKRSEVQEIDVELFKNLTPLRCLSLREDDKAVVAILKHHKGSNHGIEVDKLKSIGFKFEEQEEDYIRRVCCVMDANAFEVMIENEGKESDFRGLYPLASLVNHSCVPNLTHAFDQNKVMVVKACVPIREGQELFHSYVRLIWSTPTRQFNLVKTKHFICKCPRCLDPTEFGTYMSGILCKKCKGNVIPINPLNTKSNWRCEDCGTEVSVPEMAKIICVLGSVLRTFDDEDLELMLKFLKMKLSDLVHSNHEIAVDLKYRMVWIIGHHEKYRLKDIDDNLLDFKTNICKDLLKLLESLKLGDNKMKGLLSIEMLSCLKEKHRRKTSSKMNGHDKGRQQDSRAREDRKMRARRRIRHSESDSYKMVISGQAEKYFEGTCSILKEAVSSDVKI